MIRKTDYDVLAVGNHELYVENVARDMNERFGPEWNGKYLASNTYIAKTSAVDAAGKPTSDFVPLSDKYRYFTGTKGTKVLAFGFMFNFTNGITKFAKIKPIVEEVKEAWFAEAVKNNEADSSSSLVTSHSVTRPVSSPTPLPPNGWPPSTPSVPSTPTSHRRLWCHRHTRDYITFGPNTYAIASGRYMETVGFLSLTKTGTISRRYLNANIPTFNFHLGRPLDFALGQNTKLGQEINGMIEEAKIRTNYSVVYGCAPQDLYLSRAPYRPFFPLLLPRQRTRPAVTNAAKAANPVYVIINGGGQRYDVFAGEFTVADAFNVLPFKNVFRSIKTSLSPSSVNSSPSSTSSNPSSSFPRIQRRSPLVARQSGCTAKLGLVTKDNGTTTTDVLGDDTVACPFPFYSYPNYIYSPTTLPAASAEEPLWDLVFYDFIEKPITQAFATLQKDFTVVDYVDKSFSSLIIWPTIAGTKEWAC
ncbi:5'-nucleotidase [Chytridium lagenaria]|nr:5'-nucleotidase [Chytridium lagenaria]